MRAFEAIKKKTDRRRLKQFTFQWKNKNTCRLAYEIRFSFKLRGKNVCLYTDVVTFMQEEKQLGIE